MGQGPHSQLSAMSAAECRSAGLSALLHQASNLIQNLKFNNNFLQTNERRQPLPLHFPPPSPAWDSEYPLRLRGARRSKVKMSTQQQALIMETILGMKRTLKRKAYGECARPDLALGPPSIDRF